ncbi:MAG: hypothetical protein FJ123_04255 [Deltaproteobacteria bacterium]|nr:hypothetical protein [Deltaproteobacteria bacterium]
MVDRLDCFFSIYLPFKVIDIKASFYEEAKPVGAVSANVKVLVGGAPVTASFAESIGADGYAPDAGSAVDMARELTM